jgi:hypothetical protein
MFRFSLSTLLICIFVAALVLSWCMNLPVTNLWSVTSPTTTEILERLALAEPLALLTALLAIQAIRTIWQSIRHKSDTESLPAARETAKMQFSLSKLFLAVTIAGIGCALAIYCGHRWPDAIVSLTALLFASSAVCAVGLAGGYRVMALSFTLVGGGYLLVVATSVCEAARESMPTHYLLAGLLKVLAHPTYGPDKSTPVQLPETFWMIYSTSPWDEYRFRVFFVIGHCILALLLGLFAAWFAQAMYTKGQRQPGTITMRPTRPKLLTAAALLSLAIAGLMFPSRWYGQVAMAATILLFVSVAIAAIAMCGRGRAAAIAFCVVGSLYLAEVAIGGFRDIRQHMPTNHLLVIAWNLLPDPSLAVIPHGGTEPFRHSLQYGLSTLNNGDDPFFLIGHCVLSWLFALLAAALAGSMYAKRNRS